MRLKIPWGRWCSQLWSCWIWGSRKPLRYSVASWVNRLGAWKRHLHWKHRYERHLNDNLKRVRRDHSGRACGLQREATLDQHAKRHQHLRGNRKDDRKTAGAAAESWECVIVKPSWKKQGVGSGAECCPGINKIKSGSGPVGFSCRGHWAVFPPGYF